ncbi:LysR family transcriptional regulator [Domibacillus epiphyticus]|uniref:LysR family transcriptional regulator n=1 Tax=Domibacillus epiphyticus TaxID=1714355 RepID=A0A1V2A937_9BACI|nr:LysR family transcriptional regulator [Domibacillus epiphyticus]OMP67372.1 LysR family transcriptional regulator [Domibacillus epiphyticus]
MDLQALKVFQSVAEMGSISRAARELNYAQSNITTKIQLLETHLQTQLFYRHNRGITLTSKGKTLLAYAEKIFHLIEETNKVLKDDDQTPNGPLYIGSMETTAAVRLPSLLSKYHHEYPDVDLTLKTGPTEQNIQGILQYELDGAFVAGPIDHPELIQRTVIEEELVLITDTAHPALSSIKDIQNRTLLVFRSGCSYRAKLEQWLHQEGVIPNKIMEFGTLEAILGCVSAGLGISLLPLSVIEKHVYYGEIKYHSIPGPYAIVQTVFVYRKDTLMTTAFIRFMDMFTEVNNLSGPTITV